MPRRAFTPGAPPAPPPASDRGPSEPPIGLAARSLLLGALLALPLTAQAGTGGGHVGVVFSEFHHPTGVAPGQTPIPFRYIELHNRSRTQTQNISGVRIGVTLGVGQTQLSQPFPAGSGMAPDGTAVITQVPFPPGQIPSGVPVLVDPSFFSNPQILAPGIQQTFCLGNSLLGTVIDAVAFNGTTAASVPCGAIGLNFTGPLSNQLGTVNRVLYADSDTFFDFDPGVPGNPATTPPTSPGLKNPDLDNVNGFLFGSATANTGAQISPTSIPPPVPVVNPGGTGIGFVGGFNPAAALVGNLALVNLRCVGIDTPNHPRFSRITDPIFDRTIFDPANPGQSGLGQVQAQVFAQDALLGGIQLPNQNWTLTVPDAIQPGVLNIPMVFTTEQRSTILPNTAAGAGGRPRIERVLSDLTSDSTATGSGNLTEIQVDVLPGSTGGGDIWCDIIIYDENGFSYRAKVRNWPSNPVNCTTPNLGLGSNTPGNLDLIALCFTKQPTNRELFILPSLNLAPGPLFGLTPDAMTFLALSQPLGVHPFHVQTTVDGLYFFSLTAPPLSGVSLAAVAVEVDPSSGFTQNSPVATVTIL